MLFLVVLSQVIGGIFLICHFKLKDNQENLQQPAPVSAQVMDRLGKG